jgi:hypothetical protein
MIDNNTSHMQIGGFIGNIKNIFSSFRADNGVSASCPAVAPGVIHMGLFQSQSLKRVLP